jgi:RNA polymerase sigma-70 factor (ECF subfamily)
MCIIRETTTRMTDSEIAQEAEWLQQCQNGDKHAYGLLVTKYMKQAYYAALGYVGSHEEALDLSQEAFVRAYRSIGKFETGRRFYTWYYQILKNLCLNAIRDRKNRATPFAAMIDEGAELNHPSTDMTPHEHVEQSDTRRKVWDALWRLDGDDRSLIVARDMLDTSYKMLAELLDVPIGTVMSRLYTARRRLRQELEGIV